MSAIRISQVIQDVIRSIRVDGVGSLDDGLLLQRFIAQHDEAAFEALVRRHGPMVLGVCRRILANSQDAEDAFQATFLVLVRKAASIIPRQVVGNWLYGVAFNVARKARARRAKTQTRERQVELMPETAVPPAEDLRDLQALLDRELSRLPRKYRDPMVLCGLEGRTNKEAAQELGWPEGTLSGRLTRARQLLARRLAQQGIPLSMAAAGLVFEQAASASVPGTLTASTVRLATLFAGRSLEATKAIPAGVLALTKTVLNGLFLNKLQVVAAILLLVSAVGAPLLYHGLASPPLKADQEPPNAVPGRDLVAGRTYQLKLRKVLPGPAGTLRAARDGKTLVSMWDKTIAVWDMESGTSTQTHSFEGGNAIISPDAKTVASLSSGIKIWDVATGRNTATWGEAEVGRGAFSAAFNAGGDTLGVICPGSDERRTKPCIKLLNVATGR